MKWRYFKPIFNYEQQLPDPISPWWTGHKWFAYDLLQYMKPSRLVELGSYKGTSFFAFCQAAQDGNLKIELNAIDNWIGDQHNGFYDESVFTLFNQIKNTYYKDLNINIIRKSFEEALNDFEDQSIDLLHIDGYHTYAAVKHDFDTWFEKVSRDGIILLHDISEAKDDYGVYLLWDELKEKFPTIEFRHFHGLGVLFKDKTAFENLFEMEKEMQSYYSLTGENDLETKMLTLLSKKEEEARGLTSQIARKEQAIRALSTQIMEKEQAIQERGRLVQEKEREKERLVKETERKIQEYINWIANRDRLIESQNQKLQEITSSTAWRIIQLLWRIRLVFFPHGSRRERLAYLLIKSFHIWRSEGTKALLRKIYSSFRRPRKQPQDTPRVNEVILASPIVQFKSFPKHLIFKLAQSARRSSVIKSIFRKILPSKEFYRLRRKVDQLNQDINDRPNTGWDNYIYLSQRIKEVDQSRMKSFVPEPIKLISVDSQKPLVEFAENLKFEVEKKPLVSLIIPVHNLTIFTLECLASIKKYTTDIEYEVIIIDDGSDQETYNILSNVGGIVYVRNDKRTGFTLSCNKAAEHASGDYLVFLNNDAQVTSGWLQVMLATYDTEERVGAVGPKILFPDGRLQEAGAIIKHDGTSEMIGHGDDPNLPRYNYLREIDYCSAVCLFIQSDLFRELEGFDEIYAPAYYEDVDLCLKLRSRNLRIIYNPKATIIHHLSATSNQLAIDYKLQLAAINRQKLIERWQGEIDDLNHVKLIAFYLPQFHPVPENDLWWGKGFTEWANVVRATPNYAGHYQPHLPADLGFYDLRTPEIMEQQAEMASRYGIEGFCYYYYWFGGKRLLEMPLERLLNTGKPDFPFCLCWANENWTRTWDGAEHDILLAQNHSDEDDRAMIQDISRYMRHPNYIKVQGKPILLLYRASLLPNIKRSTDIWRKSCIANGIGEIYLVMLKTFELVGTSVDPTDYGFDATAEFPPHHFMKSSFTPTDILNKEFIGVTGDYSEAFIKSLSNHNFHLENNYLTVFPRWDNTPRRQNNPVIFDGASPEAYQIWLEKNIELTRRFHNSGEKLIFINAWNEWGEGAHLEPDQKFGHGYLEATKNAVEKWLLK